METELIGIVNVAGEQKPIEKFEFETKNPDKITTHQIILLIEMLFITLSNMYVELAIVPALPQIAIQWPKNAEWVPWCLSAYNIVGGIWTPIAGSLGDLFGHKNVMIVSMIAYAIGQAGCALASDIWTLIVFRGVQGFGMATFTLCFAIVKVTFPPKIVLMSIGLLASMGSIGVSIGLVGGAGTMQALPKWQEVFWTTFPIVVILIIAFYFTLPNQTQVKEDVTEKIERNKPSQKGKRKIDWIGATLMTIGVVLLLAGLTLSETYGWKSLTVILLIVFGAICFIAFVIVDIIIKDPLVPIRLMGSRDMLLDSLLSFLVGFFLLSTFQVVPFLLRSTENSILPNGKKTMLNLGLALLPFGVIQMVSAPLTSALGKRGGFAILSTVALGFMLISSGLLIEFHYSLGQLIPVMIVMGAGIGSVMVSLNNIIAETQTAEHFGSLTAANMLCRIIGMAVGPVAANIAMNTNTRIDTITASGLNMESSAFYNTTTEIVVILDEGYKNAFLLNTIVSALGFIVAAGLSNQFRFCKKNHIKLPEGISPPTTPSISLLPSSSIP